MQQWVVLVVIQVVMSLHTNYSYFSRPDRPLVIAHRGACGHIPQHSLEAYSTGVYMHSDYIETDVVFTQDNRMVCMHEPWLSNTTDIAEHPRFASRRRSVEWHGQVIDDWFTFDFTLQELQSLRLKQRLPSRNQHLNGFFQIPTLEQAIELVLSLNKNRPSPVGLYIEIKCPSCHQANGFYPREELALVLSSYDLESQHKSAALAPVIIQNFEKEFLQEFALISDLPRVLLYDRGHLDSDLTEANSLVHGIGPHLEDIFQSLAPLVPGPSLIQAKQLGLHVHVYGVFDDMLPAGYRMASQLYSELVAHVEGVFTEYPETAHSSYGG